MPPVDFLLFIMKRLFPFLSLLFLIAFFSCEKIDDPGTSGKSGPDPVISEGPSGITYQLLVYSFCDSDGDGCGDFAGIISKLDYLKQMGVGAIWLSPIHPSSSYHGYDVNDYTSVNPDYGTEADFKALLDAAHSKDIKVYIDYVLNHTSKDHEWFLDAKQSADSPYRDWYIFSGDPQSDVKNGKIAMIEKTGYNSGEWTSCSTGSTGPQKIRFTIELDSSKKPKTLTARQVETINNNGIQNSGLYLYYGDGKMAQFYSDYSLSIEMESDWGVLVRTNPNNWNTGTKYGAKSGAEKLSWNVPINIYPSSSSLDPEDILLPGMGKFWYHSMFGSWMPDINYGAVSTCENSAPFKAVCEAADKWIIMGVDGLRLDAVKNIYHKASSGENPEFLKKFYDHCNAVYKAAGHTDDIYMVGEQFSEANAVAPYYLGLPALFEFSFWWRLKDAINGGNAGSFVTTLQSYQKLYSQYRSDYIEATKLSNHDEVRTADDFGRNISKIKLAGAVLLSCSGEPYIYQGEELGYWGDKNRGDEYVRTPIRWTKGGKLADGKLDGKVDYAMLTDDMSVEAEQQNDNSVLKVYMDFGMARSRYEALAKGTLVQCTEVSQFPQLAAWYRVCENQTMFVVHNFSGVSPAVTLSNTKLDNMICSNGAVTVNGSRLTMGPYSSAIFLQ